MDKIRPSTAYTYSFEVGSNGADASITVQGRDPFAPALYQANVAAVSIGSGLYRYTITIPAIHNDLLSTQATDYRLALLSFTLLNGQPDYIEREYIIERHRLMKRVNAAANHSDVVLVLASSSDIEQLKAQSQEAFIQAMTTAWTRINSLAFDTGIADKYELVDLTDEEWDNIDSGAINQLIRAQLVEANAIAGGDPVGDRRRAGLMSDSNGESAQFFRPKKPLELPLTRAALNELRGLVIWSVKVER